MAIVEVLPGVCGLPTRIVAQADDMLQVSLTITSECPHIKQMAEQLSAEHLGKLSAMKELRRPIGETTPYVIAGRCKAHAACPVPTAILKAMEAAAGLALAADVHIRIRND